MRRSLPPSSAGPIFRSRRPSRVQPRSLLVHVALLLGIALAVACGLGLLLWWGLGSPDLGSSSNPVPSGSPSAGTPPRGLTAAERLDSLKVILAVVGGIGAVVALTVAYRKQRDGELAEYREDTKAFADRFGKAVDQLGNAEFAVRVGGVYALAELADEWHDGRQTCIDVLCAYLRMPYDPDPASSEYSGGNKEVRRAIIRLIRNHLRTGWTAVTWRGYRFSFEGAVFDCGGLSGARFEGGNITFHGARFVGESFSFKEVQFNGTPVWFTGATFGGERVNFAGATFAGSWVEFRGARFAADIVTFDDVTFTAGDVNFETAQHPAGAVTFDGATHTGGTVEWGPFPPLPGP